MAIACSSLVLEAMVHGVGCVKGGQEGHQTTM